MKIRIISSIFVIVLFATVYYSCSDDTVSVAPDPPVTVDLVKIDSGYVPGASAIMSFYAEDSLKLGYNKIYIVLYDSATHFSITNSHVEFLPVNHGHSAPVENPGENAVNGKFPGAIVLTQAFPNGDLHWHFNFRVHNHQAQGEPEGEVEFEVPRILDNPDRFKSIIMPDSTKLYVSYITPKTPVTGLNDFEFVIHKNEPELFPYDGSYAITSTPEFLSTGHMSANNVTPSHTSLGHYKGVVNLDQSGAWRLKIRLTKNTLSYDTFFDITN